MAQALAEQALAEQALAEQALAAAPVICLLVSGAEACKEFQIFCKTLEVWHPDVRLYVYTDSETPIESVKFRGTIHVKKELERYKGLRRSDMEAIAGKKHSSLFKEYTYEKAAAMRWAFSAEPAANGVWFCDADITMLAPLPKIPEGTKVALSPHGIREADCKLYGKYNAGFLWFKEVDAIRVWEAAGESSRFFEQAALEDVAAAAGTALYEFPPSVNFGWWRMYQGAEAPPTIQEKFSIFRSDHSFGIRYAGQPLQSVHTHWHEKTSATGAFNAWFVGFARRFAGAHKPLGKFLKMINH